jgi:hypothetical protein
LGDGDFVTVDGEGRKAVVALDAVAVCDIFVFVLFRQIPRPAPEIGVVDVDPPEIEPGVPGVVWRAVFGDQAAGGRIQRRETRLGRFGAR